MQPELSRVIEQVSKALGCGGLISHEEVWCQLVKGERLQLHEECLLDLAQEQAQEDKPDKTEHS